MGLATQNTDFDDVSVTSTTAELQEDIEPFRQAVAAGVDMIMVSVAVYPDLSGNRSAAFSKNVVQNELRGKLGFQGVIITDDLEAPGSSAVGSGNGAIQALDAGVDLALFARSSGSSAKGFTAVVKAVKSGRLDEATIQTAYDRVVALKETLGG
jgi:beta-N-acetylhexosaminidase